VISRANPADLSALFELETACFSEPWSEKSLLNLLENPVYLVLLERDSKAKARGYLIGWQVGEDAELARVGVMPEARGQGIGGLLVEYAIPIWRTGGARNIFLEVRQSNGVARRLYQARGFEEIGRRSNYYQNDETAIVLRFEIE